MFILKISKNADISSEEIAELVERHKTPQDDVLVVRTDEVLPNGFIIWREDRFLENIGKDMPEVKESLAFNIILAKQKEQIRKEEKLAKDRVGK